MTLSKEKKEALEKRMKALGIHKEDILEKFILGSGKGGQKMNKTSSCVYLKHLPTQIEVKCQRDRSQEMNRFLARRELCEQIEERDEQKKSAKKKAAQRLRHQKKRRSVRAKKKILQEKKRRSMLKALRKDSALEE